MAAAARPHSKSLAYAGTVMKRIQVHRTGSPTSLASPTQSPNSQANQMQQLGTIDFYQELSHDQQLSWHKWHSDKALVDCKPVWADAGTLRAAEKAVQEREEEFNRDTTMRQRDERERLRKLRELYCQAARYLESKIHIKCFSEQQRELARKRLQEWKELGVEGGFRPVGELSIEGLYERILRMESIAPGRAG